MRKNMDIVSFRPGELLGGFAQAWRREAGLDRRQTDVRAHAVDAEGRGGQAASARFRRRKCKSSLPRSLIGQKSPEASPTGSRKRLRTARC